MYALVDVETTGLLRATSNRIVELAIVGMDGHGTVEWAWSSLINPQRDVGPTRVHGIRARDIAQAPTFEQVAGRVAQLLSGRVFVAHNARFDQDHVEAEFGRLGVTDIDYWSIDTLQIARQLGISPATVSDVCTRFQVSNPYPHQAPRRRPGHRPRLPRHARLDQLRRAAASRLAAVPHRRNRRLPPTR